MLEQVFRYEIPLNGLYQPQDVVTISTIIIKYLIKTFHTYQHRDILKI